MKLIGQLQITANKVKIVIDDAISVVTAVAIALVTGVGQS